MCAKITNGFWKDMFVILWKKWKKLASSSVNQSVESQQTVWNIAAVNIETVNIAAVAESVCEAPSTSIHVVLNKQNCRIWGTENPHAYIDSRRSQNQSLFGANLGSQV